MESMYLWGSGVIAQSEMSGRETRRVGWGLLNTAQAAKQTAPSLWLAGYETQRDAPEKLHIMRSLGWSPILQYWQAHGWILSACIYAITHCTLYHRTGQEKAAIISLLTFSSLINIHVVSRILWLRRTQVLTKLLLKESISIRKKVYIIIIWSEIGNK